MSTEHSSPAAIRVSIMLAGLACATGFTPPVQAQTQSDAEGDEQVVVVTGSRIGRVQQEGPSPVVTITSEDLDQRGYTTVLEALNDLSQNAGGGIDQQNTFGFVPSASAVDLRGFGVGRSLVLIDGRRVPVFPLADGGTTNFVDLSSIPAGAIERIEVLTDGASAIYGSDAVGGVVNVILKKTTDDEISLRRSLTSDGGAQTRAQFATGFEGKDGGNMLLFLEYYKQNVLKFTDRSYSRSDRYGGADGVGPGTFSSFGNPGSFLNPFTGELAVANNCDTSGGTPAVIPGDFCRFNRAQYRQLIPEIQRYSLTAKYDRPLSERATLFGKLTYLNSKTNTQIEPAALDIAGDLGVVLTPDALNNPTNPAVDVDGLYPDNIAGAFRRRLVEFGPRASETNNDTFNALFGFRGTFGNDYNWETGVGYAEQRITDISTGFARKDAFTAALCGPGGFLPDGFSCSGGTLNLFEPIPQSVVDSLSTQPRTDGLSTIASFDFTLNGTLFAMPHGDAKFAFITEFNKQRFEDKRDPDVLAGNVIALGGTAGGGDRKYYAGGIEVELPIFEKLTVNLAGRFDQYDDASDVGGAFSPRIAIQYRPIATMLLRASAGKSFRAPDLQRLFGAEVTAFTDLIDTPTCVGLGGQKNVPLPGLPPGAFDPCVDVVQSTEVREGANTQLKEESGENFSGGIVWEVLSGLTLSADVFYVELSDIVNTPDLQTILDKNAATGAFADAIQYSPAQVSAINPGGLDIVSAQARNLSVQRTRGIDFSGEYRFEIGAAGALKFGLSATYLDDLSIRESEGDPLVDVLQDGTLAEDVRFKGNFNVNWTRGPASATAFVNYIGPFATFDPETQAQVGSWTTVNLSGGYELPWNGRILVGVNNVFDKDPPLYTAFGDATQPFYNQFFHDPFGATYYLNYSQKF